MIVTAFLKHEIVAQGAADAVAAHLATLPAPDRASDLLVFEDESGRQIDLPSGPALEQARGRGRPALGVKPREVTLLPRHWDWLAAQRGGASAALRRLVDAAMAEAPSPTQARDAAYRFLSAIAGDFPRFEDAIRELYQGNRVGFDHFTQDWPPAVRDHGRKLAFGA